MFNRKIDVREFTVFNRKITRNGLRFKTQIVLGNYSFYTNYLTISQLRSIKKNGWYWQ